MANSFWLPIVFIILAMVFALVALMFYSYWISHAKAKKKLLLKKVQRKGIFGKIFVHPRLFFEYCLGKDKMDDAKSSYYKIMYVISFMLWLLFFLMAFITFVILQS